MSKALTAIAQAGFVLMMVISMLYACNIGLSREAEADYQQCLSWQQEGYPIQCHYPTPKE